MISRGRAPRSSTSGHAQTRVAGDPARTASRTLTISHQTGHPDAPPQTRLTPQTARLTPGHSITHSYGDFDESLAASLSSVSADPLADRHGLPTRESALEEPGSARRVESSIKRVPRTEAERQQLLRERPYPWEYFYFAARLLHERNSVENKYRDYLRGYAAPGGAVIANYQDFGAYVDKAMRDAQQLMGEVPRVWSRDAQERAFGAPGEDGDAEAIERLAKSMNGIYEGLMDWTAKVRGVNRPSAFDRYIDLLSSINDSSISVYREFVDDLVAYDDELPARIAAGQPSKLDMNIRFTIPAETTKALNAEFARVGGAELGRIAGGR